MTVVHVRERQAASSRCGKLVAYLRTAVRMGAFRFPTWAEPLDLDPLVLQGLVVHEEALELIESMGREVGDVLILDVLGVVEMNGDDLVVTALFVGHVEDADGSRPEETRWDDTFAVEDAVDTEALPRDRRLDGRVRYGRQPGGSRGQQTIRCPRPRRTGRSSRTSSNVGALTRGTRRPSLISAVGQASSGSRFTFHHRVVLRYGAIASLATKPS
jgi:hypothetical protein